MNRSKFERDFEKSRRDFDKSFTFVSFFIKAVFVLVFVIIIAQIGIVVWLGAGVVDAVQNGSGIKEIVETVWCGANNGQGVDCVKE